MSEAYRHKFIVKGKGRFPLDMLRYDCCYPSANLYIGENNEESRSIEMTAIFPKEWTPTIDRWRSFGWIVTYHFKSKIYW